jgi:hypothetical protein
LEKLGWSPQPGEKDDQRAARALLVQILGEAGEDSRVISESVAVSHQYINNPSAVDGSLAHSALRVAALSNDPQLFNELMTVIAKPGNTPEQIDNYSEALTRFSDMALVTRWLDRIVGPETRNQDAAGYLGRELRNVNVQQPVWRANSRSATGQRSWGAPAPFAKQGCATRLSSSSPSTKYLQPNVR